MHPSNQVFSIDVTNTVDNEDSMEILCDMMEELQEAMILETKELSAELGISWSCANKIQYFRTRSRWTQEKEDELIFLDKTGMPLPCVFDGDF